MIPGRNDRYPDPDTEPRHMTDRDVDRFYAAEDEAYDRQRQDALDLEMEVRRLAQRNEALRRELRTEKLRNERLTDLLCETLSPLRVASGLLEPLAKYVEQIEAEIAR